jgi:hypothetical protein
VLGVITVNRLAVAAARLEVRRGDVKYYYNLYPGQENFPLQLGSGQYTITVFEHIEGNRYRAANRIRVEVQIAEQNAVYLNSVQEIKWNEDSLAVLKAAELVEGLKSDREKFMALYNYVVANVDYDYDKLKALTSTYLPDIDETLESGKGICYDHASLLAAMLRSQNIPAKLAKGYTSNVQGFHAWNEVYLDGEWHIVDASVDAQLRARKSRIITFKSNTVYQKTQEF